jgi:hypothetical protein
MEMFVDALYFQHCPKVVSVVYILALKNTIQIIRASGFEQFLESPDIVIDAISVL